MKELIPLLKNWRCITLTLCALCAFLLAICESDSITLLVATKIVALTLCTLCALMGHRWAKQDKINELLNLNE